MADKWEDGAGGSKLASMYQDEDEDDDNWDDEDEEEDPPPPPKPEPKKQQKKVANAIPDVDTSKMTPKEREEWQAKNERDMMGLMLGNGDATDDAIFSCDANSSKDELDELADKIADKLRPVQKSDKYTDFVQTLILKLADTVEPKHMRFYATMLTERARQVQDEEKEKKKGKSKKAVKLGGSIKAKNDFLGDVVDGSLGGAADEFDDFM